MNNRLLAMGVAGLIVMTGCAPAKNVIPGLSAGEKHRESGAGDSIDTLYQTAQCEGISRGGFILIDDAVILEDLLLPLGTATAKRTTEKVDFNNRQVLVVDFGASPSGGYSDGLVLDSVEAQGPTGVVRVKLPETADSGKRQTQNVTHSCTLYTIPRAYEVIQVRSQFDDLLIEF